jgi:hypothetical protein
MYLYSNWWDLLEIKLRGWCSVEGL